MISNFSAFPELTTQRLTLREIQTADAPLIHTLRSDDATNALIDRVKSKGVDDALRFIDLIKNNVGRHESVYWIICFKNTSELIGTICYYNYNLPADTAEVGYELLAGFRGRGIMNEVLPRVIRFGFEEMKLKTITAFPSEQNISSVKLLQKFGFQLSSSVHENTHGDVPGMLTFLLTSPE